MTIASPTVPIGRTIRIPRLLKVGHGLVEQLPTLLRDAGLEHGTPIVVTSPRAESLAGRRLAEALGTAACVVVRTSTAPDLERARRAVKGTGADLVIGVGGGTPLDVAKYTAAVEGSSFLSVPTTPSNDGIASPIAVIRPDTRPRSTAATMPVAVIADLDLLAQAPARSIQAGIGDLLANLSAVADWDLACARGRDVMDDFARLLALAGAEAILRHADGGSEVDLHGPEILETLVNGLVLSGVAMEVARSSRPASGAEHLFSHALDRSAARPAIHGAQVALGTLLMASLRDEDTAELRAAMRRFGVPLRAGELGLGTDEVVHALLHARETRPERYTILDEVHLTRESALELARSAGVV